ncbi:uncharacterized protein LOC124163262 [Ischnura elegans]|uniref:uncharacterized protein LOC124162341 n=2 Tax=Ischnura elegans TaxID=197161 RepID=UPI001ED88C0A|nr:uncharacterized protein LOC124162341 [Ischnura elegans]XP_046396001.1 uncharacterized protein LOC124163262 [Ischnura elegans]
MKPSRSKDGRFVRKKEFEKRQKASSRAKVKRESSPKIEANPRFTLEGRRIVDVNLLAKQMNCDSCLKPLSFANIEGELRRGLASIWTVRCSFCEQLKKVATSTAVHCAKSSYAQYAVNCKAAIACVVSGVGHEQMNRVLATLNIPPVANSTWKRYERSVGPAVEETARESCQKAVEEEKLLTLTSTPATTLSEESPMHGSDGAEVDIIASYDYGWQKRGNGRSYDSKSGHGSVIGYRSKKVLAFDVCTTTCAMCSQGHDKNDHDCRKNWSGSSKAMEPYTAAKLISCNEDFLTAGVRVTTLIGDGDSSTLAAVQRESQHSVQKWADINHTKKRFSSWLYRASASHRQLLGRNVIPYLKRCFSYAVDQNRGDEEGTRRAIINIANHAFGDHQGCGEWCKGDTDNYSHKSLPRGKPLEGRALKSALEKILESFAAESSKIAPGGSSQANESFNQMVAIRAPKNRHYGSSAALNIRVAAAACQKNLGPKHVIGINRKLDLSPGSLTKSYSSRMEEKIKAKVRRQVTVPVKRRRLFLKSLQKQKISSHESREGICYQSAMEADLGCALLEETTRELPPPLNEVTFVIVDIETTGFASTADIVQLACKSGQCEFNYYMMPSKTFHPIAAEKTGLRVVNGELFLYNQRVETTPPRVVGEKFISFLSSFESRVVLVGHNIVRFDAPRILSWLQKLDLSDDLLKSVYGVTDSLKLISQGSCRKLEELASVYLQGEEWQRIKSGTHNAMIDCQLLDGLIRHFEISNEVLLTNSLSLQELNNRKLQAVRKAQKVATLQTLGRVISSSMISKMATAGIDLEKLVEIFNISGTEGIRLLLGESINGKPRVTTRRRIIQAISEHLEELRKLE